MDKIILGILMIRKMTAYEIRNVIKDYYKSMCSDSLGTIQSTLKKLHDSKQVTLEEVIEKGINKKRFAITESGQSTLIEWTKLPIDLTKTKNMDFAKLLYMGYLSKNDQLALLEKIIENLKEEYATLKSVRDSINAEDERSAVENYLNTDLHYYERIKSLSNGRDISDNILEISKYSLATLDYGIDMAEFNISWFTKLKKRI